MDSITLNYGNQKLEFKKSKKFIAIKPRVGVENKALSEFLPNTQQTKNAASTIGGFQLVNVKGFKQSLESTLNKLRANPAVTAGTHVFETANDEVPFVPTGQLFIEYKKGASLGDCMDLLDKHKLSILESREGNELIVQTTAGSENPVKTAYALQQSPLIEIAEPEFATPGTLTFNFPTDGRIIDQWHLRNKGNHRGTAFGFKAGADARVIEAWEKASTLGSPNVVVAVIDDGFDLSHPDLTGSWKIVAPKDFTRNSISPHPDPLTEDWHGTACAGVAVGNADGTGIAGAAPWCRLMPVRWGRDLSDREIENWFNYVREQGAWVVSCSWGAMATYFPLSTRSYRAIKRCVEEGRNGLGTVICFAAGNSDLNINDPASKSVNGFASHPNVIAVAASNSRDQKSNYSNYGKEISVCAPSSGAGGWGITTSDVMGQYTRGNQNFEAGYSPGAYTDEFGGTSSACPLVAGICALLFSIKPDLKATEVKKIIETTARKIDEPKNYDANGHSIYFGYGCVNAASAVSEIIQNTGELKDYSMEKESNLQST
jgi:subtilisin family serine protease